ncbi:MAG: sulfur carrier protein ThiS [Bacteroidota bacterium]
MVEYTINNETMTATEAPLLQDLLTERKLAQTPGVAVAINERVIPRTVWAETTIQPQDQILIITATAGG